MGLIISKKIYLLAEVKCAKFNTNAINEVPFASKMKIDAETSSASQNNKNAIPNSFRNPELFNVSIKIFSALSYSNRMRIKDKGSKIKQPKGSIDYKIALAYQLQADFARDLLQDNEIQSRLPQLDQNIESTWKEMVSIGVVKECRDCAVTDGSCCGTGMENSYGEVLLLINLLLGRTLPSQAYDTNSCYFLGENGCLLRAREVICVNYLCQQIWRNIEKEKLIHLQMIAGDELKSLFLLEEYIKKRLRGYPTPGF